MPKRVAMLGIPKKEMTPAVSLAVSALLEKLDDVNYELIAARAELAEIEKLVDVDCIAPIPNRRAFMRRLAWALTMHARYGHPSTILYFDMNNFKQINDKLGHAVGDLAIRHIAGLLASAMRGSDFLARVGGDEFAVIMYYADETVASRRGAKIAEKLQLTPFVHDGKTLDMSAAYGYYALQNDDTPESALAAADRSMYLSKKRAKSA